MENHPLERDGGRRMIYKVFVRATAPQLRARMVEVVLSIAGEFQLKLHSNLVKGALKNEGCFKKIADIHFEIVGVSPSPATFIYSGL